MLKRTLFALAVVPLLFALVACSSSDDKSNDSSSNVEGGAQVDQTEASRDLQEVIDNYAKVKSFRAKMEITGPGNSNQEGDLEVVMPDKFHAKYSASGTDPALEIILLGADTYYKTGDSWIKQPSSSGQSFDSSAVESTVESIQSAGATKAGTDTVNGKKCQVYTSGDEGLSGKQEVCIADKLPQRYTMQNGEVKTTLTFSDYNKGIDIKAPI